MIQFIKEIPPIQKILLSFLMLIITGMGLLLLPVSTTNGISIIDALFTSTSAVCVTGLIVLDTPVDFTLFGQGIILLLLQFGGMGIMTFSIAILSMMGGKLSIKWRFTLQSVYSDVSAMPFRNILVRIVLYTVIIELITALILLTQFIQHFPLPEAIWHSIFHAISAFCNAGFSTFSDSLMGFHDNPIIVLTVATAVILGGLGFLVLTELTSPLTGSTRNFWRNLSIHTRFVLIISIILITGGMLLFLILEWTGALENQSLPQKLLTSFFQSVTCRTAGFNTVDIGNLRENTLFMMIGLMFIGGSPGSIAGGIKTTTIGIIAMLIVSRIMGKNDVVIWERSPGSDTIEKSTTLIILSFLFISFFTFIILSISSLHVEHTFLSILFEITSAFGTVGLSTGLTTLTTEPGRILMCIIMFVGRLGPLTLILALTSHKKEISIQYPEEHIMIG